LPIWLAKQSGLQGSADKTISTLYSTKNSRAGTSRQPRSRPTTGSLSKRGSTSSSLRSLVSLFHDGLSTDMPPVSSLIQDRSRDATRSGGAWRSGSRKFADHSYLDCSWRQDWLDRNRSQARGYDCPPGLRINLLHAEMRTGFLFGMVKGGRSAGKRTPHKMP